MSMPQEYFDAAGAAIGGGYRVIYVQIGKQQQQAIFDTASDIAAAARFCGVPVLSTDPDIRMACRDRGVPLITVAMEVRMR